MPRRLIGPAALAALLLVGLAFASGGLLGTTATPLSSGAATSAAPSLLPSASPPAPAIPSSSPSDATPAPATPAPTPGVADVPIVPVTRFRSGADAVRAADLRAIAAGDGAYKALVLVERDADAVLSALGVDRTKLGARLVTVASADALARDLATHRDRLGFLRAGEVGPSVRALGWGGTALFGVHRVASLGDWPLTARLATGGPDAAPAYDPAAAWTLVAGGDILLDRGVALAIRAEGVDFPFDGGTVAITGRCRDCSSMGWDLPYTKRTGNRGAVRDLFRSADLAIANFENPAPDRFRFHSSGTVFSANPAYIKGLRNAGIDWVSMANNHSGDAGRAGILQTMDNLDGYGIAHTGAGAGADAAHRPSILEAGGVKVAVIAYDSIARYYNAGADTPGTARFTKAAVKRDVRAARQAGADVVIVFPHWGVEYRATPSAAQRALGRAAIDAGADMVIGNHAHWAAAMEVYKGKPIWYALGNLVFDQTWSEQTMEGMTLELTFRGATLVQVRMRPHLILDKAQPNLLDPAGSGKVVMNRVFGASRGLLDW